MLLLEATGAPAPDNSAAAIAVLGTLAGAFLTGVFAWLAALIAARSQRTALRMQLDHASLEAIRQSRRDTYAEFVDCMERWNLAFLDAQAFVLELREAGEVDPNKDELPPWDVDALGAGFRKRQLQMEAEQNALWDRWREVKARLQLVAGPEVARLAKLIFADYNKHMRAAWNGSRHQHTKGAYPTALFAAMRDDLGVPETFEINRAMDLRAGDHDAKS